MTIKNRVVSLEKEKQAAEPVVIVVDWGGDTATINGQELSRAEAERLYPDATILIVKYESEPKQGD